MVAERQVVCFEVTVHIRFLKALFLLHNHGCQHKLQLFQPSSIIPGSHPFSAQLIEPQHFPARPCIPQPSSINLTILSLFLDHPQFAQPIPQSSALPRSSPFCSALPCPSHRTSAILSLFPDPPHVNTFIPVQSRVTMIPAMTTPAAIAGKAWRMRMPSRKARAAPVQAPVIGRGMATKMARPMGP